MKIIDFFKSLFDKGTDEEVLESNLDNIKEDIITEVAKYSMSVIESGGIQVMTERKDNGDFLVYPVINSKTKQIVHELYTNKYGNINDKDKANIDNYLDTLADTSDLPLLLGQAYMKSYKEWENEFYKDADSIEEEMWNFEIKGELKYKGFIEKAAENADNYKGSINFDITPELEHKEVELLPYVEHDENPDEVVSLENGDIELLEVLN